MAAIHLNDFIDSLQARGQYTFLRNEAADYLRGTPLALKKSLGYLSKKGRILRVRCGFYVIVPLEYRALGALPPDMFINELMRFLDHRFYVGLLSAAQIHGAAHQSPQELQVVTEHQIADIRGEHLRIRFFVSSPLSGGTAPYRTMTGDIPVSTPARTALDLVAYQKRVGGADRVATVLQELCERIGPGDIPAEMRPGDALPVLQRLGFMVGHVVGRDDLARPMAELVAAASPRYVPLVPYAPDATGPVDPIWRIRVNQQIEGEL